MKSCQESCPRWFSILAYSTTIVMGYRVKISPLYYNDINIPFLCPHMHVHMSTCTRTCMYIEFILWVVFPLKCSFIIVRVHEVCMYYALDWLFLWGGEILWWWHRTLGIFSCGVGRGSWAITCITALQAFNSNKRTGQRLNITAELAYSTAAAIKKSTPLVEAITWPYPRAPLHFVRSKAVYMLNQQ